MSFQEELNDKLFEAVEAGNQDEVRRLIAAGAEVNAQPLSVRKDRSDPGLPIETPLIYAVCNEDPSMLHLLLELGADPESYSDGDADCALHLAVESNSLEMVKLLLDYGADINRPGWNTCLMIAYYNNHRKMFDYLLERGADPAAKDFTGDNFYQYAERSGREPWIERSDSLRNTSGQNSQRVLGLLFLALLITAIFLRGCGQLLISAAR